MYFFLMHEEKQSLANKITKLLGTKTVSGDNVQRFASDFIDGHASGWHEFTPQGLVPLPISLDARLDKHLQLVDSLPRVVNEHKKELIRASAKLQDKVRKIQAEIRELNSELYLFEKEYIYASTLNDELNDYLEYLEAIPKGLAVSPIIGQPKKFNRPFIALMVIGMADSLFELSITASNNSETHFNKLLSLCLQYSGEGTSETRSYVRKVLDDSSHMRVLAWVYRKYDQMPRYCSLLKKTQFEQEILESLMPNGEWKWPDHEALKLVK